MEMWVELQLILSVEALNGNLSDNFKRELVLTIHILHIVLFPYILKSKTQQKSVKTISGYSPVFAPSNHITFSQTLTGVKVPLKIPLRYPFRASTQISILSFHPDFHLDLSFR